MSRSLNLLRGIALLWLTLSPTLAHAAESALDSELPAPPGSSLESGYGFSSGLGSPDAKEGRGTKLKFQGGDLIEGSKQTDYSTLTLKTESDHSGTTHLYKERIDFNSDNRQLMRELNFGL